MIEALWLLIRGINPRIFLGIGLCLVALYGWHELKTHFEDAGAAKVQAKWDKEKADEAEAKRTLERETRRAVDVITANSQKEKDHAKATIDSLRADVRTGVIRLSVATAAASSSTITGVRDLETRADILPASADRIIGIIGEADDTVLDLNACIDKYNAVRGAP